MTLTVAERTARTIHAAWQESRLLDGLPEELRPRDEAEAYRAQRALDELHGSPVGWKIGATNESAQRSLGVGGPFYGRLFEDCLVTAGESAPALASSMRIAEAEFAFRLARDLPSDQAPFSRADIVAAVSELIPAIELPDSRFVDPLAGGVPQLIADRACARFVVLGAPCTDWDPDALADHGVTMLVNGAEAARGSGGNVLGNPCNALVWLANALAQIGAGLCLRAGDIVITGSAALPNPIAAGDVVDADFGTLGRVRVTLPRSAPR